MSHPVQGPTAEWLFAFLSDGVAHSTEEIHAASEKEGIHWYLVWRCLLTSRGRQTVLLIQPGVWKLNVVARAGVQLPTKLG